MVVLLWVNDDREEHLLKDHFFKGIIPFELECWSHNLAHLSKGKKDVEASVERKDKAFNREGAYPWRNNIRAIMKVLEIKKNWKIPRQILPFLFGGALMSLSGSFMCWTLIPWLQSTPVILPLLDSDSAYRIAPPVLSTCPKRLQRKEGIIIKTPLLWKGKKKVNNSYVFLTNTHHRVFFFFCFW